MPHLRAAPLTSVPAAERQPLVLAWLAAIEAELAETFPPAQGFAVEKEDGIGEKYRTWTFRVGRGHWWGLAVEVSCDGEVRESAQASVYAAPPWLQTASKPVMAAATYLSIAAFCLGFFGALHSEHRFESTVFISAFGVAVAAFVAVWLPCLLAAAPVRMAAGWVLRRELETAASLVERAWDGTRRDRGQLGGLSRPVSAAAQAWAATAALSAAAAGLWELAVRRGEMDVLGIGMVVIAVLIALAAVTMLIVAIATLFL